MLSEVVLRRGLGPWRAPEDCGVGGSIFRSADARDLRACAQAHWEAERIAPYRIEQTEAQHTPRVLLFLADAAVQQLAELNPRPSVAFAFHEGEPTAALEGPGNPASQAIRTFLMQ